MSKKDNMEAVSLPKKTSSQRNHPVKNIDISWYYEWNQPILWIFKDCKWGANDEHEEQMLGDLHNYVRVEIQENKID